MSLRVRPWFLFVLPIVLAPALFVTCATTPANPNAAKYPPRGRGCKVKVYHSPAPDVKEWDDLGVAHVDCYLDVGAVQCLQKLKMEVCRMGGDMVYDVPKKPLRPTDQGMVYTGHVAHTRQKPEDAGKDDSEDGGPDESAQTTFESGPVQPIGSAAPTPADAGRSHDGGGP